MKEAGVKKEYSPLTDDELDVLFDDLQRVREGRKRRPESRILDFSSLGLGVSPKEYLRFLSLYFDQPLRPLLASRLLKRISIRSQKLYEREQRLRARGLRP